MNPFHGVSVSISPLGDRALSISASVSAEKTLWLIMADLAHRIRAANQTWIIDVVPAYETVTVVYDPLALLQTRNGEGMNEEGEVLPYEKAAAYFRKLLVYYTGDLKVNEPRVVEVPVCYGGEYGPDLKQASRRAGISEADFAAAACGRPLFGCDDWVYARLPLFNRPASAIVSASQSFTAKFGSSRLCRYRGRTNRHLSAYSTRGMAAHRKDTAPSF